MQEAIQITRAPKLIPRSHSLYEQKATASEQEFLECARRFPELAGRWDSWDWEKVFWDYHLAEILFKAEPMDYLKYQFYELTHSQWGAFLTRRQYAELCATYNRVEDVAVITNKTLFTRKYAELLGRVTLTAVSENYPQFEVMCAKYKKLMIKPNAGGYGRGIRIIDTDKRDIIWREAQEHHCIFEELIEQHSLMALPHPSSINTVRLVVLITPKGQSKIFAAVFRCGRGGAIKDNDNGLFAAVNIDSGEICTPAMSHFGERFHCHPDTGYRFKGIYLPFWEKLRSRAQYLAGILPGLRIMNWDWALRADGQWILIEGNVGGGFGPCQEAAGKGLRLQVESILRSG